MNPLTLRQTFQTANIEAIREAQGFNEHQVREAGRKRDVDERTSLEQSNVPGIPKADALRTEERKGRDQGKRKGSRHDEGQEPEEEGQESANPAEFRLDLLA